MTQPGSTPWQLQWIWQETATVVESYAGIAYRILHQCKESGINKRLAGYAAAGNLSTTNFVLANFVEESGPDIARAFGATVDDSACSASALYTGEGFTAVTILSTNPFEDAMS